MSEELQQYVSRFFVSNKSTVYHMYTVLLFAYLSAW